MNILVTGGVGFMGSHFVRHILLNYPDYRVVNFDKLTYAGNLNNVKDIENNERYVFKRGDICDGLALKETIEKYKVDSIINYAAETHVDRSIKDSLEFLKTDVLGTRELLEAVKKFNLKKMVQISTDEVFGSIETGAFTEESCFRPNSPYAASKAGGDLMCRAYYETYKTPVIVTHSCNVYGPNQYPEKLIPFFIANLLKGKKVPLYGDGLNVREWIYVGDHCRAIDAIFHKGSIGSVYNIGTGKEIKNIDLAKKILSELGIGEEMIERVADRLGHDRRYAVDSSKIRQELGWEPKMDFEDGIKDTVLWYKNNNITI